MQRIDNFLTTLFTLLCTTNQIDQPIGPNQIGDFRLDNLTKLTKNYTHIKNNCNFMQFPKLVSNISNFKYTIDAYQSKQTNDVYNLKK